MIAHTKKSTPHSIAILFASGLFLFCGNAAQLVYAASTDIANVPMAVKNSVTPNIAVIYDNSESMDAYMAGTLVSGNDANTRGNIGRQVMRNAITAYRTVFNWGLMSYKLSTNPPTLYNTWAYYLGSNTGMVFTNDCVGYVAGNPPTPGISASNGNNRCVANPQPFTGGSYVTYDKSGDDPDILDALYDPGSYSSLWGLTAGAGTSYSIYGTHNTSAGNSWASSDFSTSYGVWSFTPTDAGYLANNPPMTRQLYLPRGWGYLSNITGAGTINEDVAVDSTTHYNNLMAKLASETNSASSSEIKNGAVYTPLAGSLNSSKTYFSTSYESKTSPIQYSCQQNFVMLVTDGLPTGKTDGSLYSTTERTNTYNAGTSTWTFGTAATDAINSVTALRTTTNAISSTNKDGTGSVTGKYDIQTYVVALGSTVSNTNALAVMDAMASAGGTGTAFLASNQATFQSAIASITNDVTAKTGSAAAVSVANAHVTSTSNASYASSYNSGTWTGDLGAYAIDLTTGAPTTTMLWASGTAQAQLNTKTSSSRYIATSTDTAGAIGGSQFQPTSATTTTKLSSAQQTLLNTPSVSPVDGAAVLAYLRGDRSGETAGTYRTRAFLLGDIVNAEPVVVNAPSANYADTGYMDSTTAFKQSNASRTGMIYQGANDGMLHAFNASTTANDPAAGSEQWAYVPNLVMGALNNLSKITGFTHQYYVDGTPVSGDVDFSNTSGVTGSPAPNWHTILVGGLSKGGRGYYALDVTSPIAANEAAVASKVLWEFPNSITNTTDRNSAKLNMGYSFGKPIIVKTKAAGWVVLVTSGYNNGTNTGDSGGDGLGHLYVVNPKTGDLIKDISTTGCTATPGTSPCGLAQIAAYVENTDIDNTADYVYGGDLMGNLWRFDLSTSNVGNNSSSGWTVSIYAVLKDGSGATQPITTTPELAKITVNNIATRFVYVGTGQYLGSSDVPGSVSPAPNSHATQTQTMYGLVDSLTAALPNPLRSSLQPQTLSTSGTTRTVSNNTVNFATVKGWYVDLPSSGERINADPTIALGALIFTSNIPSSTICVPGGSSWEYFLDYKTGGLVTNSTVTWSGTFLGNALASRPVIIQLPSGAVKSLVRKSDATTDTTGVPLPASATSGKRVSWRELMQ